MGKNKLARFRENETFDFLHQPPFDEVWAASFSLRGHWHERQFRNQNPITLELGCGRGEYSVALAAASPQENFVGMDIKGARLWVGAKGAQAAGLTNVAFVRGRIETLLSFFAPGEVAHLWLTFPDPQLKERRAKKRLTSPRFLQQYARILAPNGRIHLKTDSAELYAYTLETVQNLGGNIFYAWESIDEHLEELPVLKIPTYYERYFRERGKPITYLCFSLPPAWQASEAAIVQTPRDFWLGE